MREDLVDRLEDKLHEDSLGEILCWFIHELMRVCVVIVVSPKELDQHIFLHAITLSVHVSEGLDTENEPEIR